MIWNLHLNTNITDSDGPTDEMTKILNCGEHTTDNIENMSNMLDSDDKQYHYLAHVINTAMSLFLRSKKSYDELKKYGLVCLLHPSSLKKKHT